MRSVAFTSAVVLGLTFATPVPVEPFWRDEASARRIAGARERLVVTFVVLGEAGRGDG